MSRVRICVLGAMLVFASVGAAGAETAAPAAAGCKSATGVRTAVTPRYRFALRIGMPEKMYTRAQLRTMHPKSGEVMLRGAMSGMGGMSMGASMRHLEIQICSRKTSAVVSDANPTIVVVDSSSKMTTMVPVAVMEGVGEGVADLHYGNNVAMRAGHWFAIAVTLKGERARFHLRLPKSG